MAITYRWLGGKSRLRTYCQAQKLEGGIMAKVEETITIPKKDWDKMLSLVRQANKLLSIANIGFLILDEGCKENAATTKNDKNSPNKRRSDHPAFAPTKTQGF